MRPKSTIVFAVMVAFYVIASASLASSQEKILKFGSAMPLSGAASSWGINFDRFIRKGCEDVNEAGGIQVGSVRYKWQVITYDHGYVPGRALDVVTRLIEGDKVDFISVYGGGVQSTLLELLGKHKMLNFAGGINMNVGSKAPLNFSSWPQANYAFWPASQVLAHLGIKTGVFVMADDEYGHAHVAGRVEQSKAVGINSVGEDFYPRGTTEFYPLLRRLLAKNPDFFDVGTGGIRDNGLLIKQAREIGFKGPMLAYAVSPMKLEEIVGKELLENTYMLSPPFPGAPMKGKVKTILDWFVSKYGAKEYDAGGVGGHAVIEFLTKGIKDAQSIDPFKVADAMGKISKEKQMETSYGMSYIGNAGFDLPRVITFWLNVYQYKDGTWHELGGGWPSYEWKK